MCVHIHVLVLSALPSVVRFPGRLKPNVVLLQRVETAGALAGTAGAGRDSPGLPAGIAAPRPGTGGGGRCCAQPGRPCLKSRLPPEGRAGHGTRWIRHARKTRRVSSSGAGKYTMRGKYRFGG